LTVDELEDELVSIDLEFAAEKAHRNREEPISHRTRP
jgi:hypothetical protein